MSEQTSQMQQMKPYIIVAAVLFVLLVAVLLWPTGEESDTLEPVSVPVVSSEPEVAEEIREEQNENDEVFSPPQAPSSVVIGQEEEQPEALEPVIEAVEEITEPAELDLSDAAIKAAVVQTLKSPEIAKFLVDDALLQKFVINVNDLANEEITLKDNLLVPPSRGFDTYNQADKVWIDRTSFQRYTPYVDALESVEAEELLTLYDSYKPTLSEKFAEISRPGENLDDTLIRAIDELLDTPMVPVPIEVYSDSVMYKFADPKLEALSGPQKQMIRMGPDNMRRLKDVLRDLKSELESR